MSLKIYGRDQQRQRKVYSQYRNPVDPRERARRAYSHARRRPRFLMPPLQDAPVLVSGFSGAFRFFNTATFEETNVSMFYASNLATRGITVDHTGKKAGTKHGTYVISGYQGHPWAPSDQHVYHLLGYDTGFPKAISIPSNGGGNFVPNGLFDNDGFLWHNNGGNGTQGPAWTIIDPSKPTDNCVVEKIWRNSSNWNVSWAWSSDAIFREGSNSIYFPNSFNQLLRISCGERRAEVVLSLPDDVLAYEWIDSTKSYRQRDTIYVTYGQYLREYDADTKELIKQVDLNFPEIGWYIGDADGIAYDYKNHHLWIPCHFSKNLVVVDARTGDFLLELQGPDYGFGANTNGRFWASVFYEPTVTGSFGTLGDRVWYYYTDYTVGTRIEARSTKQERLFQLEYSAATSMQVSRHQGVQMLWNSMPELGIPSMQSVINKRTDVSTLVNADPKNVVSNSKIYEIDYSTITSTGSVYHSSNGGFGPPMVVAHYKASGSRHHFYEDIFSTEQHNLLTPISESIGLYAVNRISDISENSNHLFPFNNDPAHRCYWTSSYAPFNGQPAFLFVKENEHHMVSSGSTLNYRNATFEQKTEATGSIIRGTNLTYTGIFHITGAGHTDPVGTAVSGTHGLFGFIDDTETGIMCNIGRYNDTYADGLISLYRTGSVQRSSMLLNNGTQMLALTKAGSSEYSGLRYDSLSTTGNNSISVRYWSGTEYTEILPTHTGSFEIGKVGNSKYTTFAFTELMIYRSYINRETLDGIEASWKQLYGA